jgi:hypothetical protein
MCAGGGSAVADGTNQQLNLSIGGTPVVGTVDVGGGAQVTFGLFSTSTY